MGLLQVSASLSGQKRHSQDSEAVGTLGQISNKSTTDTSPQPPSCALVKRSDIVITTFTVKPAPPVVPIAIDFTLKAKQTSMRISRRWKRCCCCCCFFFTYSTLSPLVYPSIVLFSPSRSFFPVRFGLLLLLLSPVAGLLSPGLPWRWRLHGFTGGNCCYPLVKAPPTSRVAIASEFRPWRNSDVCRIYVLETVIGIKCFFVLVISSAISCVYW